MLRPLDLVVVLKVHSLNQPEVSQGRLAEMLRISSRSVNEALKRAELSRLYDPRKRCTNPGALEEALIHGVRYFFPAERGPMTRGVPTSWGAPPLAQLLTASTEPPPVWPDPQGTVRGAALYPLHESVSRAVADDIIFYELLTLVDTLREGRAREARLAISELRKRIRHK
jgi:hypothetical protein